MANDIKLAGTRRKSLTTMMAALLAGSIAATAGGVAFAKTDGQAFDPAKFQQRIEKRVDKALGSTDATTDQKKKVSEILQAAFKDMKGFHGQRVENRKAMEAAMQAPTIDAARIEQIRAEQMKIADASSKRFTQALVDAGNVLNASQRQAFFKAWGERHGKRHG
jgi:Spy/CpxP family protein refolding chaperone